MVVGGCQTQADLLRAYTEAVENLRVAVLALGDVARRPEEAAVYGAAQGHVDYQRSQCESILKALRRHLGQHGCVSR